jgi:hypothetical protein
MPFPFIPGGALLALAVLGGALAIFGVALKALDWTIDAARGSMLGGVVSGIRNWELPSRRFTPRSPAASPAGPQPTSEVLEDGDDSLVALQRVSPAGGVRRGD